MSGRREAKTSTRKIEESQVALDDKAMKESFGRKQKKNVLEKVPGMGGGGGGEKVRGRGAEEK